MGYKNGVYWVYHSPNGPKLWRVSKYNSNSGGERGFRLYKGDIMKIGRVMFKIKDYTDSNKSESRLRNSVIDKINKSCKLDLEEVNEQADAIGNRSSRSPVNVMSSPIRTVRDGYGS